MKRDIIFKPTAQEDMQFWSKNDLKKVKKILDLVEEITKTPFTGTGKPEPLQHEYSGYWSRRIDQENRLIYEVREDKIVIVKCRFHY